MRLEEELKLKTSDVATKQHVACLTAKFINSMKYFAFFLDFSDLKQLGNNS